MTDLTPTAMKHTADYKKCLKLLDELAKIERRVDRAEHRLYQAEFVLSFPPEDGQRTTSSKVRKAGNRARNVTAQWIRAEKKAMRAINAMARRAIPVGSTWRFYDTRVVITGVHVSGVIDLIEHIPPGEASVYSPGEKERAFWLLKFFKLETAHAL